MIEAVRFQENVFSGKAQVSALYEVVLITRVFQDIAEADILRKKLETEADALPSNGRKQRYPALGSDHSGNRVVSTGELGGVVEIRPSLFSLPSSGVRFGKASLSK